MLPANHYIYQGDGSANSEWTEVFKLPVIFKSAVSVMRGRLECYKLKRGVLNHEQAASEPSVYTTSILNMGYFRELIQREIFLGTVLKGTMILSVDYHRSHKPLTGVCLY